MTREDVIAALSWSEDLHLDRLPTRFASACGDPAEWTDAELALMLDFSERRQADYVARYGTAKFDWADNFITVMRETRGERVMWSRKRLSWREGAYWSPSLPEAIGTFDKDDWRDVAGRVMLTIAGEIVRIEKRDMSDFHAPLYHDLDVVRLRDGATLRISSNRDTLFVAPDLKSLGDRMRMAVGHRIASAHLPPADEVAASRLAFTSSDAPADLERMWTARVRSMSERGMATSAETA